MRKEEEEEEDQEGAQQKIGDFIRTQDKYYNGSMYIPQFVEDWHATDSYINSGVAPSDSDFTFIILVLKL